MSAYENKIRGVAARPGAMSTLLGRVAARLGNLLRSRTLNSPAALSYRFLARQIANDLPRIGAGRTVLLSSAVPAASSNEAILMFSHAIADELDARVLLVDGTFGAEGVGNALGFDGATGLMDLVYDSGHDPLDTIQETPRHNIALLPAGRPRIGRQLPIGPDRIAELYRLLCARFDYVIVQQGSIIADTRYLVCAAKAELILVLVEEGVTPVEELDRSLDVFRGHQISGLRLVLCEPR